MQPYEMRTDAYESKIFYQNRVNKPKHVKTYYPPYNGETDMAYARRYKISVPWTSVVVDRIVNILAMNLNITIAPEYQEALDKLHLELNYHELFRNIVTRTLIGGNLITLIKLLPQMETPIVDFWDGEFVLIEPTRYGIEYFITKEGTIRPVLSAKQDNEKHVKRYFDTFLMGEVQHNYGFNPSVLSRFLDRYEDGIYGKPYPKRFIETVQNYNQLISNMHNDSIIFQNVWTTNRSTDNPERELTLTPYQIQMLGEGGELKQAARELDFTSEEQLLNRYEHSIAQGSHVPLELIGLKDAGKLASGRAMEMMMLPMREFINRLTNIFAPTFVSVIQKTVQGYYRLQDKLIQPPEVEIHINKKIAPDSEVTMIEKIQTLKAILPNYLTEEKIVQLLSPYISLEGEK